MHLLIAPKDLRGHAEACKTQSAFDIFYECPRCEYECIERVAIDPLQSCKRRVSSNDEVAEVEL